MVDIIVYYIYTMAYQNSEGERYMNDSNTALRDKILFELYQQEGNYLSGEALATQFAVSRNAVNKAVTKLKSLGYTISAVTNKGYALDPACDKLSAAGIESKLAARRPGFRAGPFIVCDLTDSTNSEAKRLAMKGAPDGTVVLAEAQADGRGRMARNFFSPTGSGLYYSLIVKPRFDISKSVLVTAMAAVATARAIASVCGTETEIKWVNDLYYGGKKVVGILTEAISDFESGTIETVIIGIGINVREPAGGFPDDIKSKAGSLPLDCNRNELAAELTYNLLTMLDTIEERTFLEEYNERSMVLGRPVKIMQTGRRARAVGLTDDAGLIVQYGDGTRDILSTGEISITVE